MFVLWNKVIVERSAAYAKITKVRCEETNVSLEDSQELSLGWANAAAIPSRIAGEALGLPSLAITSWEGPTLVQRRQSSLASLPG